MNHLAVGAAIPFIIGLIVYLSRGCRASLSMLIVLPVLMAACATWAVLPDLPRTFGIAGYDTDVSMNPVIDIFFWHYTLNLHETDSPWYTVAFVGMLAALFAAAWRELRLREKG